MINIRLPRNNWQIDLNQQLGSRGGFGTVYAGAREGFPPLAIKRLDITSKDSANRELRIAEQLSSRDLKYIIPIFDSGQDAESDFYYVVMARAERSLAEELRLHGQFKEIDAANVLLQIVAGLEEVSDIVHRDLKPANILLHARSWKIGDFGIAKFIEDSTSLHTLKECLSPPYAAPEQWEFKQATGATDLYSLGCIAYELVSGHTPFTATTSEDYQQQHLYSMPIPLLTKIPLLRTLVSMLLRKSPESRPSIARVRTILEGIISGPTSNEKSPGLGELALAGAVEAERAASVEARATVHFAEIKRREKLADEAFHILNEVIDEFFSRLLEAAPNAQVHKEVFATAPATQRQPESYMNLGTASMKIGLINIGAIFPPNSFPESKWDVICGATITVSQADPTYVWSGNLWYTNLAVGTSYRWYETSYFKSRGTQFAPFSLVSLNDADLAHSNIMHAYNVATSPKPIDGENIDDFIGRWSKLFALAVKCELRYPPYLPID